MVALCLFDVVCGVLFLREEQTVLYEDEVPLAVLLGAGAGLIFFSSLFA